MRTGVVSYIAERGDFCRSEAILSRWVHCLQRVPPSVQFSTSLSLSAQVAKTPLCVQTVTSIVSKSQLGWFRGPLRVQFSLVDSSTSCLVDLPTWNLSIFAGRGGRPRHILIIQHCFFTHSMDVVALDVLQFLVVTANIEEAKSSSAIFFLPCPQNRATLGQIVQIVITTKSTTKFLLERRGASLQRGL